MANTSRQFEAFAKKRRLDFLVICGAKQSRITTEGSVRSVFLQRSPLGFALDTNHRFDLAFWRHYDQAIAEVRKFAPDIVHITGPSDVGQLGALLAHRLGVPLAASWHTNLHQYAEQRVVAQIGFLPKGMRERLGRMIRGASLAAILRFYAIADILFAPNVAVSDLLAKRINKAAVYSMRRGVDTALFAPEKRDRRDGPFTIGYVGRLTAEKNVRFLVELERALIGGGFSDFRFSIVGQGAEERWLKSHLERADFSGVLKGEALARAYANFDVFVFPSQTDTFGNVVLEALASGVPAIVTDAGGPQYIIRPGETGLIARSSEEFVSHIRQLAAQPLRFPSMRAAARAYALNLSWDRIFDGMYAAYEKELRSPALPRKSLRNRPQPKVASERLS